MKVCLLFHRIRWTLSVTCSSKRARLLGWSYGWIAIEKARISALRCAAALSELLLSSHGGMANHHVNPAICQWRIMN